MWRSTIHQRSSTAPEPINRSVADGPAVVALGFELSADRRWFTAILRPEEMPLDSISTAMTSDPGPPALYMQQVPVRMFGYRQFRASLRVRLPGTHRARARTASKSMLRPSTPTLYPQTSLPPPAQATQPPPYLGPTCGRNGYITPAFSGVPNTGTKNGEKGGEMGESRGKLRPTRPAR